MRILSVQATFFEPRHKTLIEETAAKAGLTVQWFDTIEQANGHLTDTEVLYGYWPADYLIQAKSLKWFATASAGVNTYLEDSLYADPEHVLLTNSNVYGVTISEHMIMMSLMLMRRQPEYFRHAENREWKNVGTIRSVKDAVVTIVGTGDIGTHYARSLKALGAKEVIGVRRTAKPADKSFDKVMTFENLKEAVSGVDIVALCIPETALTKGLISKEVIDCMDKKTFVINVGRGSAVDQDALIDALNHDRLAGAALDVMIPEPLPKDSPLYTTKNVILTPHISGNMSLGYTCDLDVEMFVRNLERYGKGEPLHHVVDRKIGY